MRSDSIDLRGLASREALHALLRERLSLPDWYGNNLDALRDVLSETAPRELIVKNADAADEGLRDYLAALRRMLADTADETPGLAVRWEENTSDSLADRAQALRDDPAVHYNCAQGVLVPFAEAAGLDPETAYRLAANFGGGMKRASVCGAVNGGLMALGLLGVEDGPTVAEYHRRLKAAVPVCHPLLPKVWYGTLPRHSGSCR